MILPKKSVLMLLSMVLVVGDSGSEITNALLSLINHRPDIKINLFAKDSNEPKYQSLIKRRKELG